MGGLTPFEKQHSLLQRSINAVQWTIHSSYNGHGEGEIRIWDKQLFVNAFPFSHKCLRTSESFAFASKEHKGFAREDANASLWNAKVFEREHKTFARVRSP